MFRPMKLTIARLSLSFASAGRMVPAFPVFAHDMERFGDERSWCKYRKGKRFTHSGR
jgi:hypothetical protein